MPGSVAWIGSWGFLLSPPEHPHSPHLGMVLSWSLSIVRPCRGTQGQGDVLSTGTSAHKNHPKPLELSKQRQTPAGISEAAAKPMSVCGGRHEVAPGAHQQGESSLRAFFVTIRMRESPLDPLLPEIC